MSDGAGIRLHDIVLSASSLSCDGRRQPTTPAVPAAVPTADGTDAPAPITAESLSAAV